MDTELVKKGAVLDSVDHKDVMYFAPEPEIEVEDDATNSTAVDDASNTATALPEEDAGINARARDTSLPAANAAPRTTRDGGKLAVNLVVHGHYNVDLDVDFDFIVVSILSDNCYFFIARR